MVRLCCFRRYARVKNPLKGCIIAANNPTVSLNYPHVIDREADHGYRARRILDMIEEGGSDFTVEDMKAMQGDDLCNSAFEILARTFEKGIKKALRNLEKILIDGAGRKFIKLLSATRPSASRGSS